MCNLPESNGIVQMYLETARSWQVARREHPGDREAVVVGEVSEALHDHQRRDECSRAQLGQLRRHSQRIHSNVLAREPKLRRATATAAGAPATRLRHNSWTDRNGGRA